MGILFALLVVAALTGYMLLGWQQAKWTVRSKVNTFREARGRHVWIGGLGGHAQAIDERRCEILDVLESATPASVLVRLNDGTERYAPLANIRWLRLSAYEEEIWW